MSTFRDAVSVAAVAVVDVAANTNSADNHGNIDGSNVNSVKPINGCDDEGNRKLLSDFGRLIESNPALVDKWLREQATDEVVQRLQRVVIGADVADEADSRFTLTADVALRTATSEASPKRAASVTSDLFQQWLASSATASPLMVRLISVFVSHS